MVYCKDTYCSKLCQATVISVYEWEVCFESTCWRLRRFQFACQSQSIILVCGQKDKSISNNICKRHTDFIMIIRTSSLQNGFKYQLAYNYLSAQNCVIIRAPPALLLVFTPSLLDLRPHSTSLLTNLLMPFSTEWPINQPGKKQLLRHYYSHTLFSMEGIEDTRIQNRRGITETLLGCVVNVPLPLGKSHLCVS